MRCADRTNGQISSRKQYAVGKLPNIQYLVSSTQYYSVPGGGRKKKTTFPYTHNNTQQYTKLEQKYRNKHENEFGPIKEELPLQRLYNIDSTRTPATATI